MTDKSNNNGRAFEFACLNELKNYVQKFGKVVEYYELLEHCLGSLEQVKSKGWSRTEPAPIL